MPIWFEANRPKCKWSILKFIYTKRSIWIPNTIIFNLHWLHTVILAKWFDIQPNAWVCQLIFHFTADSILINIISNLQSIWRTFLNISHKRFKTIANVCWKYTFVVWILIRSMNVYLTMLEIEFVLFILDRLHTEKFCLIKRVVSEWFHKNALEIAFELIL